MVAPKKIKPPQKKIPKTTHVAGGKKTSKNKKADKKFVKKRNIVRGKDVTVGDPAAEMQLIYGLMRVGGVLTFIDSSQDNKAYLITGNSSEQNELVWTAKTAGAGGNDIHIKILVPVSNPTLTCTVVGTVITITCKSNAMSVSDSTMSQVIAKVAATPAADALVLVRKLNPNHNQVVNAVSETALAYGGGKKLYLFVTLAGHEIDNVETMYVDNKPVTFGGSPDTRWAIGTFANKVFMGIQFGNEDQEVQSDLHQQLPDKWTDTDRQRGCAGVYLQLVWDSNTFPNGYPDINFLVKGKKVYDPRTATTGWSRNPILCIADFLTNQKWGCGLSYSDLHTATLNDSADVCDQLVDKNGGGTEARYCLDGQLDASMTKQEILNEMLATCGGDLVYQSGQYYIYAAKYRAPTYTITEDDIIGEIRVSTNVSRSDSFNGMRGTFVSPQADYNEADVPAVKNDTYIAADGGKHIWEDTSLTLVTQSGQAQRLFKIELEKVRQGLSVTLPCKLKGLLLQANDTVYVTFSKYGWSAKIFEVEDISFVIDADGSLRTELNLRETASGIYDWNSGEETIVDLAPNSDLPDPTDVEPPTGLTLASGTNELYRRLDGTIHSRLKVSWTESVTEFVQFGGEYQIQYKRSTDTNWSQNFSAPGGTNFIHILDVEDGVAYDVRIRSVNTLRYFSSWVTQTAYVVIGKTEPPSDVTVLESILSDSGITLSWEKITDFDADLYEIRVGANWAAGTVIASIRGDGESYTWSLDAIATYKEVLNGAPQVQRTTGLYNLMIKSIDTTGNYALNAKAVQQAISAPNPIENFAADTIDNNILLDWLDPLPGDLSVDEYDVYKGTTLESAVKIGTVFGTFHTYIESLGGTFTYWVVAVDVGGNRAEGVSATVTIVVPRDFYILDDQNPALSVTNWGNIAIGGTAFAPNENAGTFWGPTNTHVSGGTMPPVPGEFETWENWFDNNGWTTLQDAIDAGFVEWLQPSVESGFAEMQIDYGVNLPASFVAWTWGELVKGDPSIITTTLSTSLDGTTWTDYENATQLFTDSFRYIKLKMTMTALSELSLSKIVNQRLVLSLKRDEETGSVACNSADSGGTTVVFTKPFIDVEDIQLTPEGTTACYAVLNFIDVPNPTSFKVLVFDQDGNRVSKTVRYRVRGAVYS